MKASPVRREVLQILEGLLDASGAPKKRALDALRRLGPKAGEEIVEALTSSGVLFRAASRALVALGDLTIEPITQSLARRRCDVCGCGGARRGIGCGSLAPLVPEIYRNACAAGDETVRQYIETKTFGVLAAVSKREHTCVGGYGQCLEALGRCGLASVEACRRAYPNEAWSALDRLQRRGLSGLEAVLGNCKEACTAFQFYVAHVAARFRRRAIPILQRNFRSEDIRRHTIAAYALTALGPAGIMAMLQEMQRLHFNIPSCGCYVATEELKELGPAAVPMLLRALRGRPGAKRVMLIADIANEMGPSAKALAPRFRELRARFDARSDAADHIYDALEAVKN